MLKLSEELRFEEAEEVKRKYIMLDSFVTRSEVVSHTINNVDVFSITSDEKLAFINYIHVSNGSINQSFTIEYKKKLNESDEELLQLGIIELRQRFKSDKRSSYQKRWMWNLKTSPSRSLKEVIKKPC